MPRKPAFNVKMVGREFGADDNVPIGYTQSMTKFRVHPYPMICRSVNRDHPYMRIDGSKPQLHRGRKP